MRLFTIRTIAAACAGLTLCAAAAAAQTSPTSQTQRPAAPPPWTADVSNDFTNAGPASNQNETSIRLTRRVHLRSSVYGEIDQQNRYDALDTSLELGVGHAFGTRHLFEVSGSIAFGLGDPDNIAERVYGVKGKVRANAHVSPLFEFERSVYRSDMSVNELTLGARLSPGGGGWVEPVYVGTDASISPAVNEIGHAFGLQFSVPVRPSVSFVFKGGYGHEHALAHVRTVVEVVRRLKQLSLEPGIAWQIDRAKSLQINYTFENKYRSHVQHGFTVDFTAAF